jgi:hypothetical protein
MMLVRRSQKLPGRQSTQDARELILGEHASPRACLPHTKQLKQIAVVLSYA